MCGIFLDLSMEWFGSNQRVLFIGDLALIIGNAISLIFASQLAQLVHAEVITFQSCN